MNKIWKFIRGSTILNEIVTIFKLRPQVLFYSFVVSSSTTLVSPFDFTIE